MQTTVLRLLVVTCLLVLAGCKDPSEPKASRGQRSAAGGAAHRSETGATARPLGPETSAVPVDLSSGWCGGHGVPESVCARCNAALIPQFKAAGDWCVEHGLPESQCALCHPEVAARWAALNPDQKPASAAPAAGAAPAEPASEASPASRPARLLQFDNDPFCVVEQTPVRFRDAAVARQAGIVAEPAARRSMTASLELPGEIDFDHTRLVRITPLTPGVVREVAAPQGAVVEAGDLLAVIESPTLGEAKSKYIELRATLTLAQADFWRAQEIHDGAQTMLTAAVPEASSGDVRKAVSQVRVGAAKSTMLKAHAELLLARSNALRAERLLQSTAGTQQELETTRAALAAAEAEFYAEREAIAFSVERDQLAAERALHVARSQLEAAERRLHALGVDEAQLAALGTQGPRALSRYELRAPVAGTVVKQLVAVGEAVDEKDALLEVADLGSMWLIMDAQERDLSALRTGLPVLFVVEALNRSFRGEVTWIDPVVDDRTRTIKVRAELPNEEGVLRAMMFGRARIAVHENERVLTVPAGAVQTDGCCQLVFVRQTDDLYQPRKVVLGTRSKDYVEVMQGLSEGEAVVTTGSFLLKTEILKSSIGAGCCEVEPGR